jgi:DNA-binding response OmpR family regulator
MTPLAHTQTAFAEPQPTIGRTQTPARRAGTPQVLVIDSDTHRRELLADVVTRAGGRPAVADTGAETIERLSAETPECLLVADLPDGSARAFIAWARPRFPEVAIVAVADGAGESTELYHAGADLVAPMPLDADLLGAKLAAAMRSAQRTHLRLVPS